MGKSLIIKGADFSVNAIDQIPGDYQKVASIVCNVSTYNFDTGVFITDSEYVINWEGKFFAQGTLEKPIFADYDPSIPSPASQNTCRVTYNKDSKVIKFNYNKAADSEDSFTDNSFATVGLKHTIELDFEHFILDGVSRNITNPVTSEVTKTASFVFGLTVYRVMYFSILHNGTKLREYIPCRKLSNNALGFYDTVAKEFTALDSSLNPLAEEL